MFCESYRYQFGTSSHLSKNKIVIMSSSGSVKQLLKQANERYFAVFRMCMRLHREKLPDDLRGLGDSYVRKEFRRTMVGSTTPEQMEMLKKNLKNISGT